MHSYRDLFRSPEFTPLFLSSSAATLALTISGLALGTMVYQATASPLLSAMSMFGPQLAQVIGATFMLSAADRLRPRSTMATINLAFAICTAVFAVPGLPISVILSVVFLQGLISSVRGGMSGGLLNEILPKEGFVLGRSVFNMNSSLLQIIGFAAGGALLTILSPSSCLLIAVGLYVASAIGIRFGLTDRPPRAVGRPSVRETWRTNRFLLSSRPRRLTYLGLCVPNGLIIGCESLYPSYAPHAAGTLFASSALGMLIGNMVVGRFIPQNLRPKLTAPLLLLLAVPYLLFAFQPQVPLAALAACIASLGFGASLVQQERLMALTPNEMAGHTLGLYNSAALTMQGVAALLAGTVAQLTKPGIAMMVMAATSIFVTLTLAVARRREALHANAMRGSEPPTSETLELADSSSSKQSST